MSDSRRVLFGPFLLDAADQRLHRGEDEIALRPKTFAVLVYLVERAGRLVRKDELLDAVWRDTAVTDSVLKISIREIREALEDDAKEPRFIETEHGSGYRFIGTVSAANLPLDVTTFVGREEDVAALKQTVLEHRFVTLTGPGGVGKSRLALKVARELADTYRDGVWWVELASLSDARFVSQTVASTLGIRSDVEGRFETALQRHLRMREVLLVLDNCEHLVQACATLAADLLRGCAAVTILTTSRESLGSSGERVWNVRPLACPEVGTVSAADVANSEAVRLFADRATDVDVRFAVTDRNASALAEVSRRLDGLPLAIELAARRVRALPVDQIAARLEHSFELLLSGSRSELPRHQTLAATIDWSVGLLSPSERELFVALGVFAGGWSLEAAESISDQALRPGVDRRRVAGVDALLGLVEKSLVVASASGGAGEGRYRFLETVRQYARAKLFVDHEKAWALQQRHAQYYTGFAESIEPRINTSSRVIWINRLDVEHDNLRAALDWGLRHDVDLALRLAGALRWFWFHRGYWTEGRTWLDDALKACDTAPHAGRVAMRARALLGSGVLAWTQGDRAVARRTLAESVTLSRRLGDQHLLAESIHFLANEILAEGDARSAHMLAQESVAIYRREGGDPFGLAVTLATSGIAAMALEEYATAREALEESAAVARAGGDSWALSLPLRNLGIVAFRQGDIAHAKRLLRESLTLLRELREKWFISRCFETMAAIAALEGECERAACLFGAGENLRQAVSASVLPAYLPDYNRGMEMLRSSGLSEPEIQAAWNAGRGMPLEEALRYALDELPPDGASG